MKKGTSGTYFHNWQGACFWPAEWRTQPCSMPGQTSSAQQAPGVALAPQSLAPPAPAPAPPAKAPPITTASMIGPGTQRGDPSPPTLTLSSQGPAPYGLLPKKRWPQRRAKTNPTQAPVEPQTTTGDATQTTSENSEPSVAQTQQKENSSLTQKLWNTGWSAIIRGHQQRAHAHSQHRRPTPLRLWGVLQLGEYIVLLLAMGSQAMDCPEIKRTTKLLHLSPRNATTTYGIRT